MKVILIILFYLLMPVVLSAETSSLEVGNLEEEQYAYEKTAIEASKSGGNDNHSDLMSRVLSGELKPSPKVRKQFAANMEKSLKNEPEYKGIKTFTAGKDSTIFKMSFPNANGLVAAALAAQPDVKLLFYTLGFKKFVVSNHSDSSWDFPIELD